MAKREMTVTEKLIRTQIPDFFHWHEGCQKQVVDLVERVLAGDHAIDLSGDDYTEEE